MPLKRILGASLVLAGVAFAAAPRPAGAQTNGFVLHCLSARASSQGCVTRAREGVPTNLFRDPAAMAWFERPALEANVSAFTPFLTFSNAANPGVSHGALHSYPMMSAAFVGPEIGSRLDWAVGIEPIGGFGSDFKLRHALLGDGQDYESFFAGVNLGPTLALEVAPGLSIGVAGYARYAQIRKFRMPFTMPPQAAAGLGALFQMDEHYPAMFSEVTELTAYGDSRDFGGWALGTTLGAAWRGPAGLHVSASWSPKSTIHLDGGHATIDMSRQFEAMFGTLVQERMLYHGMTQEEAGASVAATLGSIGMDLSRGAAASFDAETELTVPQTAGLGVSFNPGARWNVAVEGVWMDWSAAESIMPFILTDSDNPNVNILVNGDPENVDFTYPFPLHWQDSWTVKAGLEYGVGATTALRAGYLYGENPVPDRTVFIAFPAISTQAITAGVGFQLGNVPLELSIVHAMKSDLDGCDEGHMLGVEYVGSASTMRQTVVTFGAVWGF